MDIKNYFKDFLESIPDYKKIVLNMFLIKNDNDLITECGFFRMILIVYKKNLKTY